MTNTTPRLLSVKDFDGIRNKWLGLQVQSYEALMVMTAQAQQSLTTAEYQAEIESYADELGKKYKEIRQLQADHQAKIKELKKDIQDIIKKARKEQHIYGRHLIIEAIEKYLQGK